MWLKRYLSDKIPEELSSRLVSQMWLVQGAVSKPSTATISHEAFVVVMGKLLKGTMEEMSHMVCCLATENAERLMKADLTKVLVVLSWRTDFFTNGCYLGATWLILVVIFDQLHTHWSQLFIITILAEF